MHTARRPLMYLASVSPGLFSSPFVKQQSITGGLTDRVTVALLLTIYASFELKEILEEKKE
jgi:hypothetical protein